MLKRLLNLFYMAAALTALIIAARYSFDGANSYGISDAISQLNLLSSFLLTAVLIEAAQFARTRRLPCGFGEQLARFVTVFCFTTLFHQVMTLKATTDTPPVIRLVNAVEMSPATINSIVFLMLVVILLIDIFKYVLKGVTAPWMEWITPPADSRHSRYEDRDDW